VTLRVKFADFEMITRRWSVPSAISQQYASEGTSSGRSGTSVSCQLQSLCNPADYYCPGLLGIAVAVRDLERPSVASRFRQVLDKRQDDLAREPLVAPIKMHLTPELAYNDVFHNARAEPPTRGRRDSRPVRFNPMQTDPSLRRARP
jgi:hypothetical protein